MMEAPLNWKDIIDAKTHVHDKTPIQDALSNPNTGGLTAAAAAKPPIEGKVPDKQPVDKPVKSDKEKVEIKENKPEAKETKVEFKEHKNEAKDLKNEAKEHKSEAKEHVKDFKEKNDFKEHKDENKEFKIELKEHSKSEFEKPFRENVKDLVEGGQKFAEGGDPFGVGPQELQAATAIKHTDKIIEKNNLKPEGKIEIKDHKNENKDDLLPVDVPEFG